MKLMTDEFCAETLVTAKEIQRQMDAKKKTEAGVGGHGVGTKGARDEEVSTTKSPEASSTYTSQSGPGLPPRRASILIPPNATITLPRAPKAMVKIQTRVMDKFNSMIQSPASDTKYTSSPHSKLLPEMPPHLLFKQPLSSDRRKPDYGMEISESQRRVHDKLLDNDHSRKDSRYSDMDVDKPERGSRKDVDSPHRKKSRYEDSDYDKSERRRKSRDDDYHKGDHKRRDPQYSDDDIDRLERKSSRRGKSKEYDDNRYSYDKSKRKRRSREDEYGHERDSRHSDVNGDKSDSRRGDRGDRSRDKESHRRRRDSASRSRGYSPVSNHQYSRDPVSAKSTLEQHAYPAPEDMRAPVPHYPVPGLWFVKVGLDQSDILDVPFEVEPELAKRFLLKDSSEVSVHILCLSKPLVEETLRNLDPVASPEIVTNAIWNLKTEWPQKGKVIIQVNSDDSMGRSWLPMDLVGYPIRSRIKCLP